MSNSLIHRHDLLLRIQAGLKRSPVTAMIGPRQSGKTTIARQIARKTKAVYLDLEDPTAVKRLENPMLALELLRGLIVIDEVQLKPALFPILRVLADRRPLPARFLILGSASPDLIRGSSESLAGRIEFVDIHGFSLEEVGVQRMKKLWWRGGFPPAFLAKNDEDSRIWIQNFGQTFLERDIRKFGVEVPPATLRRFWNMTAHYHGQIWSASDIANSLAVSYMTTKRHLDILTGALMIRQLPPWHENLGKRQVKSPKVYLRDAGVLHALLEIESFERLESHMKLGASWEGFALEQILSITGDRNAYFWSTQSHAELDLLVFLKGKRFGFEFKYSDAPSMTRSMHVALEDLKLEHLYIVYPGKESYPLNPKTSVLSIFKLPKKLAELAP